MKNGKVVLSKPVTSIKQTSPSNLNENASAAIAAVINPLVADAFALFVKTKNYHWHMSGPHYRDYHLLLDEQAEQIFAMIDVLAERVRKLGQNTIRSIEHIQALKHIRDDNEIQVAATDMLRRLLEDNKHFAMHLQAAHEVCDENADIATASLLENFMDETERRSWFLFETIKGQ